MKKILFATGNSRKIIEAESTLGSVGIEIEAVRVEIDEIQHHDPVEITKAKAVSAYNVLGRPVVVQDTNWSIPALNGFPGGYMKDVTGWFSAEDWLNLMAPYEDKSIICREHVVYFDGESLQHFEADFAGHFTDEPRGEGGDSIDRVVCLYGSNRTLSEMSEETGTASTDENLEHWRLFADWAIK